MKVILLQDVAKVGRKHEVREVADGFGMNFLIGQGKAIPATPANLARLTEKQKVVIVGKERELSQAQKLVETLAGAPLILKIKTNKEGHLFAALHSKEVATEIKKQFNLIIAPEMISSSSPIKTTGQHKIALKAGNQVLNFELLVEAI